jgi:diguanylate cyclase (GGDEF)-like protein
MKPPWRDWSLGTKIGLLMTSLALAIVFIPNFISIQRERQNFRGQLETQAELLLETLALTIRDPLYRLERDELNELALSLRDNPELSRYIVYDSRGRILVDSAQPGPSFSQIEDPLGVELISLPAGQSFKKWEPDQLLLGQPVLLGNQVIGAVLVGLSTVPLEQKIEQISRESQFLAVLSLVLGALFSFILARQITTPLSQLTQAAADMAQGNLGVRAAVQSRDEIGRLGTAFNQMADAIQERERDLRDLAQGLEQTVEQRTAELREKASELELLAISDPLTRVYNRRHFFRLAEIEVERATRERRHLSLILMDADHFKPINDTYGHQAGDQILINLAQICQDNIRKTDIFARYGGEEFVLLMPETDLEKARATAERLRLRVAESTQAIGLRRIPLTISLGVTSLPPGAPGNITVLVAQADQALYQSKQSGRNRVSVVATA